MQASEVINSGELCFCFGFASRHCGAQLTMFDVTSSDYRNCFVSLSSCSDKLAVGKPRALITFQILTSLNIHKDTRNVSQANSLVEANIDRGNLQNATNLADK